MQPTCRRIYLLRSPIAGANKQGVIISIRHRSGELPPATGREKMQANGDGMKMQEKGADTLKAQTSPVATAVRTDTQSDTRRVIDG